MYSLHPSSPVLSDLNAALISVNMLRVQTAPLLLRQRNISNKSVIINLYFGLMSC